MDARREIQSTLTRIRRRWFASVWLRVTAWAVAAVVILHKNSQYRQTDFTTQSHHNDKNESESGILIHFSKSRHSLMFMSLRIMHTQSYMIIH